MEIHVLTASQASGCQGDLVMLLQDAVSHGASVGFVQPLTDEEAQKYWSEVIDGMQAAKRFLWIATADQQVVGTVQLALTAWPNGDHRAEVLKLLVHTRFRQRGIGRALMQALEPAARAAGRSLLVLDTRAGDPAEELYHSLGYTTAGIIPNYARSPDGAELQATRVMYKILA